MSSAAAARGRAAATRMAAASKSRPRVKRSSTSAGKSTSKKQKTANEDASSLSWYHFFTKGDEEYDLYMAEEWGFEKRSDRDLFEKLSLEGAQAGLSWKTILTKREAYRRTFHNFDVDKCTNMKSSDITKILETEGSGPEIIVRHKGKIESVINNAKMIQKMRKEELKESGQTFGEFLWSFVDDKPILNSWKSLTDMASKTEESEAMRKALKKRGFRFVGPTTCYSMMQACGFVIDHPVNSKEWNEAKKLLEKRPGGYQKR
uniref:DNA-3-methyladenine glycosylase I n=1 Tax=Minutocellus polymorphus TaxID=265543 RepID=A0A7S0ADF0_9STRA